MDSSGAAASSAAGGASKWLNPTRYTGMIQASTRTPILQTAKTALAATVAWIVCLLILPAELPVFGAVAALIVVQPSVNQTFAKAAERSVGVIIGVIVAYCAGIIWGASSWIVLLAIVVSLLLGWALKFSQATSVQIPISAMLVLSIGAASADYAFGRIIETVIGAVVAVAINFAIVPPVRLQPVHDAIALLGREVSNSLETLGALIDEPSTQAERTSALLEVRLLQTMYLKARAALTSGEETLKFNPRRGRYRDILMRDELLLETLRVLTMRIPGMVRALDDHYDDSLHDEPTVAGLGDELTRAAHDLRLVMTQAQLPGATPELDVLEVPTLTAPFLALRPSPTHWVVIGSLIEDARRVHEVIVEAQETLADQ